MIHGTETGLDDQQAIAALRSDIEAMSITQLESKRDELLERLNQLPAERSALDQRVQDAKAGTDASRLTAVLHGEGANDLEEKEHLLEVAIAARQRLRIEAARLEYVLRELSAQIGYLHSHERYKATSFIEPHWKAEQAQSLQDLRQALARFFAIELRLQHVPNPASIKLDHAFINIFETAESKLSKLVVHKYAQLIDEAQALYEAEGRAKCEEEERKAAGREAAEQRYKHLQERMNPDGKTVRQIIREPCE